MYPPKPADQYFPQPPLHPGAPRPPPPSTGFPVPSGNKYYTPAGPQPFQVQSQPPAQIEWSTGLCDCCDNIGNCCITWCCPCITFGQIAEIVDRGSTSCGTSGALYTLIMFITGCPCIYACFYRSKLRAQYGLREGSCPDCITHCFCQVCALTQEYRELQNRGFDMSIGWHANMEKQAQVVVPPPVVEGMTR